MGPTKQVVLVSDRRTHGGNMGDQPSSKLAQILRAMVDRVGLKDKEG